MHLPNYHNGSIVNLMSSIGRALGWKSPYNPLPSLKPSELKSKNIVLIVIDGLGYEFLKNFRRSTLFRHTRDRITSVLPATTSSGVTTFHTGVAPQQHAVTGWFMHLREAGLVSTPLRFVPRGGKESLAKRGITPKSVFDAQSFFNRIKVRSYAVYGDDIVDSEYNSATSGRARKLSYSTLRGFFLQTGKAIRSRGRKYVYAYWGDLDWIAHRNGT